MKKVTVILLLGFIGCTPMIVKNYSISYTPRVVLVTDYASTSSNLQGIIYRAWNRLDRYDSTGLSRCRIQFADTNFVNKGYGTVSDERGYFKVDYLPGGVYNIIFHDVEGQAMMIKYVAIYSDSIAFIKLNILNADPGKNRKPWD